MSTLVDIKAIKETAAKEVREELTKKAVVALKSKLRTLDDARKVVANIEREIVDLEASIGDGSFA